jgi:hypothetical protein
VIRQSVNQRLLLCGCGGDSCGIQQLRTYSVSFNPPYFEMNSGRCTNSAASRLRLASTTAPEIWLFTTIPWRERKEKGHLLRRAENRWASFNHSSTSFQLLQLCPAVADVFLHQ